MCQMSALIDRWLFQSQRHDTGAKAAARKREWAVILACAALVTLIGINLKLVRVEGNSMWPSVRDGETVLVWRTSSLFEPYRAGDVVVFRGLDGDELIKRVCFVQRPDGSARMPDSLWTPTGQTRVPVLMDGLGQSDFPDYAAQLRLAAQGERIVRTLYVMGDNTWDSFDSRDFGPVDPGNVMGKVIARVTWPFSKAPPAIALNSVYTASHPGAAL
jgi:signal peptidase I